jgi:hypothetical protein
MWLPRKERNNALSWVTSKLRDRTWPPNEYKANFVWVSRRDKDRERKRERERETHTHTHTQRFQTTKLSECYTHGLLYFLVPRERGYDMGKKRVVRKLINYAKKILI